MKAARVRQEGAKVLIECPSGEIPWKQAIRLGRALINAGRKAEAEASAGLIIADAALGIRSGFPIGLAPTERHAAEAIKSAQWDSKFRRALPVVRGPGRVYAPRLRQVGD